MNRQIKKSSSSYSNFSKHLNISSNLNSLLIFDCCKATQSFHQGKCLVIMTPFSVKPRPETPRSQSKDILKLFRLTTKAVGHKNFALITLYYLYQSFYSIQAGLTKIPYIFVSNLSLCLISRNRVGEKMRLDLC